MEHFTLTRLQGRAVEDALSKDGHYHIRMKRDGENKYEVLKGPDIRNIRVETNARVETLLEEMKNEGLHRSGAEATVIINGEDRSVDLRIWSGDAGGQVLTEVKWTRQNIFKALEDAKKSRKWLLQAISKGRWKSSRHPVQAVATGALAITPRRWILHVTQASGGRAAIFQGPPPAVAPAEAQQKKKRTRKHKSGYRGRRGNEGKEATERAWRKGEKGKKLDKKCRGKYRASAKGKATNQANNDQRKHQRTSTRVL